MWLTPTTSHIMYGYGSPVSVLIPVIGSYVAPVRRDSKSRHDSLLLVPHKQRFNVAPRPCSPACYFSKLCCIAIEQAHVHLTCPVCSEVVTFREPHQRKTFTVLRTISEYSVLFPPAMSVKVHNNLTRVEIESCLLHIGAYLCTLVYTLDVPEVQDGLPGAITT